jgi:hypothetical protein
MQYEAGAGGPGGGGREGFGGRAGLAQLFGPGARELGAVGLDQPAAQDLA